MCTILLIDNSQKIEQSLHCLSEDMRMTVDIVTVPDSESALAYLSEGNKADILFTDIDQPTSGGMDFFERISPEYPQLRCAVAFSTSRFEMVKYAVNLRMSGFVNKPVEQNEVVVLLQRLIPDVFCYCENPGELDRRNRDKLAKRRLIGEVLAIIEKDVDKDIGLEYISEKVHISPCYLSALFRETMGQGLASYITNYRMDLAASLLRDTNLRIYEVAVRVGYRSSPYFCTVFKNYYRMTPSQFREAN